MKHHFSNNIALGGFAAGLGAAALSCLVTWLNPGQGEILVTALDFLAGLPVIFVRRLELPKPLFYIFFFLYWGVNGAGIARLLIRRRSANRESSSFRSLSARAPDLDRFAAPLCLLDE